ncbi:hypothetical protein [Halopelagius longus]|uniref:Uncharacterized protein n=1 Tax=Halopelagius longus TaxID=1236180 RepID=A0A1H0ZDR3_9EURY|nr:hypothetical protein [Halopelagius longus]RDI70237.1 hypothetical protein DWB78_00025 [Halopelagius longus]SDQ25578.1 hypothetical protein SAMN05216278_1165 [Halopelagius longus]
MPSRRHVLALLAAAPFAGCGAESDESERTTDAPLSGRTVGVAGDVSFPPVSGVSVTSRPADADAFVLPASDAHYESALDALERGTPAIVAGDDAPLYARRVCERSGRRYGLPSDSWSPIDRIAAVVPVEDRLDVQYLRPRRDAALEARLPWAVGEILDGRPPEFSISDPPRPDGGVELGEVRTRGRVKAGDYDRWDRVTLLPDRSQAVVETTATVTTVDASFPDGYLVDDVSIQTAFEGVPVDATGPAGKTTDAYAVTEETNEEENRVTHTFSAENADARRSLTVGARTVVSLEDRPSSFGYVGNARFRWRRRTLLGDDPWVAHTPGRSVWRTLPSS